MEYLRYCLFCFYGIDYNNAQTYTFISGYKDFSNMYTENNLAKNKNEIKGTKVHVLQIILYSISCITGSLYKYLYTNIINIYTIRTNIYTQKYWTLFKL